MKSPVHILLCDHRGAGLEAELAPLAGRGYVLERTNTLRRSLRRLEESPTPGLVVLDPLGGSGTVELETLDRGRHGGTPLPLLVVVERGDEEALVRIDRALGDGIWDVIARGSPLEEIELRIGRLLEQVRMAEEMHDLRHRASHDDRTDLLRPAAFQARLVEHFSAAQRHDLDLALVLVDLDRFGAINKQYDHTVGDRLISQVGEVIRKALRTEDVAGRLGGDEFAVLLPYTRKIDAARVVNRLRDEILKLSGLQQGAREPIPVSASIGFETFDGKDLDSLETLRQHAERALRSAKVSGGDRGVYYRSLHGDTPEAEAAEAPAAGEVEDA